MFSNVRERTLRFFSPLSYGKTNCYSVPTAPGRYRVRVFTVYDNYDSKLNPPNFDVAVENTVVFGWRRPWPDLAVRSGAYSDVFAFSEDGNVDVCFYSASGGDAPVIGSLEVIGVEPLCYDTSSIGKNLVLINYGRLTCGSELFTDESDLYRRIWQSDASFRTSRVKILSTNKPIVNSSISPDYFPSWLYQSAITSVSTDESIDYSIEVDVEMNYVLWFHFAEIDPSITKVGQRVFDITVDGVNVKRMDIFKQVGSFTALQWRYVANNLTKTNLSVKISPVVGVPLMSGLENYAMAPRGRATLPTQVMGMKRLKDSLEIPDRMGWNGDPCAPSGWDAWEGVTCHGSEDGLSFAITQLDLGSQGLKGYISDQIHHLSNLVRLNLSSNSLHGALPSGIGQGSLQQLDLSRNRLSGSIPDISSSNLKLVLLNSNDLEGLVPEKLYSVGVHGGAIDLSGNKGLCGVPSLPSCSLIGKTGKLSRGLKLTIGFSCAVALLFVIVLAFRFSCKTRTTGYDCVVSQEPTPISKFSGKRNKYRSQKSMVHLELQPQNSRN